MSLINDALKRAKQAQQDSGESPVSVPPLRPVEPTTQLARNAMGVLMPIALVVVALLGLMFLWVLWKREGTTKTSQQITAAARTPGAEPEPATVEAATTPANRMSSNGATATGAVATTHSESNAASPSVSNQVSGASEQVDTNHLKAAEAAPSMPPPLKLQSIVYNPKSPSAMINGRIVFVGDRIRDFRVAVIHRDEVMLTSGSRTNLLSLEP